MVYCTKRNTVKVTDNVDCLWPDAEKVGAVPQTVRTLPELIKWTLGYELIVDTSTITYNMD